MAGLQDLLSWMDSKRRLVGRNLSDLIQNPAAVVDQWDDQAKGFNRNTEPVIQGGQLSNRPMTEDQIRQKYTDLALNAPMGAMTAWHGSPHKFDKFSLDKIGTGEGAQAYGHGLYLAETPEIAGFYKDKLSNGTVLSKRHLEPAEVVFSNTGDLPESTVRKMRLYAASYANKIDFNDADSVKSFLKVHFPRAAGRLPDNFSASSDLMSSGNLYKTDIPDEAVARFLDWDKPLSQQAPEVQAALNNTKNKQLRAMMDYAQKPYPESIGGEDKTMGEAFRLLNLNLQGKASADSAKASALLAKQGIPGIRYLDGGSRSAGAGSSNFVAFDPEMIRILERNGVETGAKPWAPGEYRLKDLIGKE